MVVVWRIGGIVLFAAATTAVARVVIIAGATSIVAVAIASKVMPLL